MTQVLPYLGVEPKYSQAELEKLDGKAPDVVGKSVAAAKNEVAKNNLSVRVYGDGKTVTSQVPEPGKDIPKSGTVVLFTDSASASKQVTVPSLTNLSLSDANQKAADAGINITITGAALTSSAAVSSSQDVAAGMKVAPGTVVTVTFSEKNEVR
jgi:stage V sporulation protein D (sporulation-specific penicillin-binding protein)